jgi:transcriptional regulator with XRE-family HTH domain
MRSTMRHHRDVEAEAIAGRLQRAAKARGFTSDRARSGVDVAGMANAIGASYEMARRYCEGLATPTGEVARAISGWLKVRAAWLLYGEGGMEDEAAAVNENALQACLEAVENAQVMAGVKLSHDRAAQIVAALYREAVQGSAPSASSLAASLRVLAN